jgi:hypothetical protein
MDAGLAASNILPDDRASEEQAGFASLFQFPPQAGFFPTQGERP